jgi:hypothetical protein
MKRISRETARAKGLLRYFTGAPCSHGHVAERYAHRGHCVECVRESGQRPCRFAPKKLKRCPTCKGKFLGYARRKFCSKECAEPKVVRTAKLCPACKEPFLAKPLQKFCSIHCQRVDIHKRRTQPGSAYRVRQKEYMRLVRAGVSEPARYL